MSASASDPPTQAAAAAFAGMDGMGNKFASAEELWQKELKGDLDDPKSGWYGKAISYWANVSADVSGVLGGLVEVHDVDVAESRAFLEQLPGLGRRRALDCGAGIGRVSKNLLCPMFECTDLLEPLPHMLEEAKKELAGFPTGQFIQGSMQTHELPEKTYDLIVIQWAALYLTDADFTEFVRRCRQALTDDGYLFIKENVSSSQKFVVDNEDSSLTRPDAHYLSIFEAAGAHSLQAKWQVQWPKELFPVKMYAFK